MKNRDLLISQSQAERLAFLTVAAAELASFLPGEICSVLETRRFYQFDAASAEARDGIRVLTPAGGGRLLHAPWVMNATEVEFSTPTTHLPNLQAVVSHNWSASLMDGGGFTDNGNGTYSVASAEAALRQPTGGQGATIGLYAVAAVSNQSIPDGTQTYVTVKLTGSTAAYATQQDLSLITGRDEIEAYSITRTGNQYHVVDLRRQNVDHAQLACRMEWDTKGISKVPGTAYSSSASSRYLQVSAGKFHIPIRLSATSAFDTSSSSTFTRIHGSTANGWSRTTGQTQIDNTSYNDGTGTLGTLTANQWGVRWVFIDVDSSGASLVVLIGGDNGSEANAKGSTLPSDLPPELRKTAPGVLISKIIIQKNATSIDPSWIENYDSVSGRQSSPTTEHNSLGGILGNGFYHLSEGERDAATRIASPSQSGLMSADQSGIVSGLGVFYGLKTEAQRDAITSPGDGSWIINTSKNYRVDYYSTTYSLWIGTTQIVLTNSTGSTSVYGKIVALESSDYSAKFAGYEGDPAVIGVIDKAGVATSGYMPVTLSGIVDVLVKADQVVTPLKFIRSDSSGLGIARSTPDYGTIFRPLESKTNSIDFLVKCLFHATVA